MENLREPQASQIPADHAGEYSSRSRVERVIAVGRLVVLLCCLLAFRLDPSAGVGLAPIALAVLGVYFLYLVAVVAYVWTGHAPAPRWRVADQTFDGTLGLFLLHLTGGTSSPFFFYLSFSVLFATLRWQWRGALGVGVPTTLGFVVLGVAQIVEGATRFEPDTFIMHTAYLAALTGLLCSVGAHERQVRRNILAVATWSPPSGLEAPHIEEILQTAAAVVRAPRAVLAWAERGQGTLQMAFLTGAEVACWDDEDWKPEDLVADELRHVDFLSHDVSAKASAITWIADGRLARRQGTRALPDALWQRFAMRSVIAVRLHSELVRGRLFLLDMPDMTSDDLVMAGLLARQVQCRLEDRFTARRFAAAAAAEERVQLARDVHDGALQSFTGIRLQLEVARRLIMARPEEAERILLELQDLAGTEHRSLRRLISRLQRVGVDLNELEPGEDLADRITVLVLRIERQWNVQVRILSRIVHEHFDAVIPLALIEELYQVLREALVNAARHARAKTVSVSVGIEKEAVRMTVADDGQGFPFTGRYDLARLTRFDMGPIALRKRVAALGGGLTIDSSREGARLEISIPLAPPSRLSVPAPSIER